MVVLLAGSLVWSVWSLLHAVVKTERRGGHDTGGCHPKESHHQAVPGGGAVSEETARTPEEAGSSGAGHQI